MLSWKRSSWQGKRKTPQWDESSMQTQTSCCPCSSPNPPSLSPAVWNMSQPCSSSRPTSPKKTETKSKTLCQRHWLRSQPPTHHRFSPKSRSNETSMTGSTERWAFLRYSYVWGLRWWVWKMWRLCCFIPFPWEAESKAYCEKWRPQVFITSLHLTVNAKCCC